MKLPKQSIFLFFVVMLVFPAPSFAWHDDTTHKDLSALAATVFFGPLFMKGNFYGKTAEQWVRDGAMLEDEGTKWQFGN